MVQNPPLYNWLTTRSSGVLLHMSSLPSKTGIGNLGAGAYAHIDPERAKVLPTNPKYLPQMVAADDVYWGEHKDAIMERFNTWLLS